jgi:RNA polymerase sigma factor (TIGR02999 family)
MSDVTRILSAIDSGDAQAAAELLPLVYAELRRLAASRLRTQPDGQTLQPTALVHEAFLRLIGPAGDAKFQGRAHFFGAAAEAMRRILIDRARAKRAARRGSGAARQPLTDFAAAADDADPDDLLALDEALEKLRAQEPVMAELVKLRYFAGLDLVEAAAMLGIARSTADRYWTYARAWLFQEVSGERRESA